MNYYKAETNVCLHVTIPFRHIFPSYPQQFHLCFYITSSFLPLCPVKHVLC